MSPKPMQDIVPKGSRSIRNVPTSEARAKAARKDEKEEILKEEIAQEKLKLAKLEALEREEKKHKKLDMLEMQKEQAIEQEQQQEAQADAASEFESEPLHHRKPRKKLGMPSRKTVQKIGLVAGVLAAIALLIVITNLFHSATITVTPRTASLALDSDFTARKTAAAGELPFQSLTIVQPGSEIVRATGQRQVTKRATGIITIFNAYSAATQRLIKNTRFATPEGLIFRTIDSVTVPGEKGATPGSVDASVIADEAGASYNVGLKDFTIPGFKGDPRYESFYARSKTALAGGFAGIEKLVSDADRTKARADIEAKLRSDLVKQVADKRTADSVIYDKTFTIEYKMLPDEAVSSDQVNIKEEGSITAVVFDKRQLSAALARNLIAGYKGEPIVVTNIDSLTFVPKDVRTLTSDSISFHVSGNTAFEWLYDETALKTALKGQSRATIPTVLQKFPMIGKADISISPFWSRSFPGTVDKITVKKAL